jgi:hypothetical protein
MIAIWIVRLKSFWEWNKLITLTEQTLWLTDCKIDQNNQVITFTMTTITLSLLHCLINYLLICLTKVSQIFKVCFWKWSSNMLKSLIYYYYNITQMKYSGCCIMGKQIMVLMGKWDEFFQDWQVPNYSFIWNSDWSSFAYSYCSVNGICYGLDQSDSIKRCPL